MQLAWLTDIHLNFVAPGDQQCFYSAVKAGNGDAVLVGGDIAEAPTLVEYLHDMERVLDRPVYFVLGNHDFYRSSIKDVHARVKAIKTPHLIWLTHAGVQLLSDDTALIGDDGWADGRFGDYFGSTVFLNDYVLIREFKGLDKSARFTLMRQLSDAAAARVGVKLREACALRNRVILLTHVPPFRESAWHEGKTSEEDWLPHFSSKAVGDAILSVMNDHPDNRLLVLCGHTHGAGVAQPSTNVIVKTGGAEYGRPVVQAILDA